ncbi:MAG TPA: serine/threonine-protein kinase [Planctomycetaceae bacterium]|jgi:serine/threonine protein kinase|nr:serine/threonine-protein kinase [Planctomycetaceae bacterium]
MSVSTKGEFFRLLKRSELLSTEDRVEAKHLCQGVSDAALAADTLVKHKLLTEWQSAQLLLGRTQFHLGKYKLLKFRGRGAMGIVFKAQHPDFDRSVAIKVLPKSIVDRPRSVARFLREIRSTAVLNHPNLVVAYDADVIDGTYCLIMEYVTGRSLKMLVQQFERLPPRWACDCVRQAALALQHIHDCGLVHRDVKPSNLLVTTIPPDQRPVVKLLDIGLARFVSEAEEEGGLTRAGQIVGTGNYMAPEQVTDARKADIRADIYGLGVTFYELLTGTPPLAGQTLVQTYMNRLRGEAPRLSTVCPEVPRGLDAVVAKMLKRDPGERYQTPAALAADLAAILEGSPAEVGSPFFAEIRGDEPNLDEGMVVDWPADHRTPGSLATDPTLSVDATVPTERRTPTENVADVGSAVPFAIPVETAWPPARFDSSSEVSILGSADSSTSQASDDPAADSSVVEFLQLLDVHSSDVFQQFGQRFGGTAPRGGLPGLAAQSSQFLRDLVKGLAHKARSKRKKRVVPKTTGPTKARAKSKTRRPSALPKTSVRKKSSRPKPDRD